MNQQTIRNALQVMLAAVVGIVASVAYVPTEAVGQVSSERITIRVPEVSGRVEISGDGESVLYRSSQGIAIWDLSSGVSTPLFETPVQMDEVAISDDGSVVAFLSSDPGLGGQQRDLFVLERSTGEVTNYTSEFLGIRLSYTLGISGDGNVVAIGPGRVDRLTGDPNLNGTSSDIVLLDRSTGEFTNITPGATRFSNNPSLNFDGSKVVFYSRAGTLTEPSLEFANYTFLWERAVGLTNLAPGEANVGAVHISSDGMTVALSVDDATAIKDLETGAVTFLAPPEGISYDPAAISGSGDKVAVRAHDLSTVNDLRRSTGLFMWSPATGELIDEAPDSNGWISWVFSMSTDGERIAFTTPGTGLTDEPYPIVLDQYNSFVRGGIDIKPTVTSANSLFQIVDAEDFDPIGIEGDIARLYQAFFDRTPDANGVKYWIGTNRDSGLDLASISEWFGQSTEFANNYDGTSDTEYLTRIYSNVLGRDFDQNGFNYWLDLLQGTNEFGSNAELSQISRTETVLFVTAGQEFRTAYPFTTEYVVELLSP